MLGRLMSRGEGEEGGGGGRIKGYLSVTDGWMRGYGGRIIGSAGGGGG